MARDTPVERLMTTGIETVSPDTNITAAAESLLSQNAGSLVALDDHNHVSGILTCTDLAQLVAENSVSDDATVEGYMTTDVATISPEASVQDAASKMITHGIQHLPVTDDDGEIIGMLSTTDVTNFLTYSGSVGTA